MRRGLLVNGRTDRTVVTYLDGVHLREERLDDGEGEKRVYRPFYTARLLCELYYDRVRYRRGYVSLTLGDGVGGCVAGLYVSGGSIVTKERGLWGPTLNLASPARNSHRVRAALIDVVAN